MRRLDGCCVALLFCLLWPLSARAASEEARRHRDAAQAAFEVSQYERAIEEFRRAYELEADPRLFYNLGLSHSKSYELHQRRADLIQARDYFRRFLAVVKPDDPAFRKDRKRIEQIRAMALEHAARLDEQATRELQVTTPEAPIVRLDAPPPAEDHTASWGLLTASGVLLVSSTVTGVFALSASNRAFDLRSERDLGGSRDAADRAQTFALATDGLLVLAAITGGLGLALRFLGGDDSPAEAAPAQAPVEIGARF